MSSRSQRTLAMAIPQLTINACTRLDTSTDYTVLVSTPILKVVDISDLDDDMQLSNFVVTRVATLTDGEASTQVVLPDTLRVWSSGTGQPTLKPHDVIKVQRMLRLPQGDASVILVHDVEIFAEKDVPLEVTDYEDQIHNLQAELKKAQAALKELLEEQQGVSPSLMDSVLELVEGISLIEETAS